MCSLYGNSTACSQVQYLPAVCPEAAHSAAVSDLCCSGTISPFQLIAISSAAPVMLYSSFKPLPVST